MSATAAGVPLLRLAAQTALLEAEALAEMGGGEGTTARMALAVNADSMSTWFTGVFAALDDVLFDIRIEDQDHSARLLREGVVLGAVTTERTPVSGCRVQPLGVMRYIPVASAAIYQAVSAGRVHGAGRGRGAVAGMESRRCTAGHVGAESVSTGHQTAAALRSDRGGLRARPFALGWAGECSRTASPHRTWRTARLCGFLMCTSMCRCSGNAGSSIVRWSRPSPTWS